MTAADRILHFPRLSSELEIFVVQTEPRRWHSGLSEVTLVRTRRILVCVVHYRHEEEIMAKGNNARKKETKKPKKEKKK